MPVEIAELANSSDKPLDVLRKRFFKGFAYNLNDPRSPSLHLNRTPLVFEDTLDKTLNLDDTFADLFVESRTPETVGETTVPDQEMNVVDVEMPEDHSNEIADEPEKTHSPQTPVLLQQQFDPRSPSIGVERTPILFTDDDADNVNEDLLLENILTTLSLNFNASPNSSIVSMTSSNTQTEPSQRTDQQIVSKPTNKHLDRVRIGKKTISKGPHRKPKRRLSRQQIYEDDENRMPSTPKLKNSDSPKSKRTPLSCVRNRNSTNVRSRSVESSVKSIKTRLPLTSFDDSLNPSENNKILSLRIMQQGSQDSLELSY